MRYAIHLCILATLALAACGPTSNPDASAPGPCVQLPASSPFASATLQIASATQLGSLTADGRYAIDTPTKRAQLVLLLAEPSTASGSDQPDLLLLRLVRPGVVEDIDATSTANALLALAPFLARSEPGELAALDAVLTNLPAVVTLAGEIDRLLLAGTALNNAASDPAFAAAFAAALEAALQAVGAAGSQTGVRWLVVTPSAPQSLLQVLEADATHAAVRNWGGRWLSAWAGPPGADELVGIIEPSPKLLSLASAVAIFQQGTLLPHEETTLDLGDYGKTTLRLYGLGAKGTLAGCEAPSALGDRRALVPALATLVDRIVAPSLDLALGLDVKALPVWQDFSVQLVVELAGDTALQGALAASPVLGCAVKSGDCDDDDASRHPAAAEVCDLVDNDCDAQVDDVDPTSLYNNPAHCGACGKSCLGGQACVKGVCGVAAFSDPADQQTKAVKVSVTQVEQAPGGKVKAYASVQAQSGDPIEQLTFGNFQVVEVIASASASVAVDSLETAEASSNGLRAALVIDSSGSMYTDPPPSALELAKAAAKEFVSYPDWCRRHRHRSVRDQHAMLCKKIRGHFNYFAINGNCESLQRLIYQVG